ncbi:MAG: mechanosensitive ion channel domain-containing protein [Nanoarchaeota archaeon]|nr:mechanosensitive ion channel family protein [Nanoarchaeota archaeon]
MKTRHKGPIAAILLLIFFLIYFYREIFYLTLQQNYELVNSSVIAVIPKFITIILIIILAKLLISIISSAIEKYSRLIGRENEYVTARSIVKYAIWILALMAILSVMVGDLGVWLTSVGLVGFGITFALQKPILNFVGWLSLMFNKAYSIGDRIKVSDVRGDVVEIQMMYTVMDGLLDNTDEPSGKIITIPNEMVLTGSVTNYTKNGEYLWDELSVDITYESNWQEAIMILKDVAFQVVNKYIGATKYDHSEKKAHLLETLDILKFQHKETEAEKDKEVIAKRIGEVTEETKRIEGAKKYAFKDMKREPIVRVELRNSSVGLNVRYLAHYRNLKMMKSEINSGFLYKISKTKKVEIAYPHLQIIK